jgi:hypothetical protein
MCPKKKSNGRARLIERLAADECAESTDFELRVIVALASYRNTLRYIAVMLTVIAIVAIAERF